MFCFVLVSLQVGTQEHKLWHPQQLPGMCIQVLFQLDDSRQLQQEPQALRAQQTEHDSLQDLTCFRKYLICRIRRNSSLSIALIRKAISSDHAASISSMEAWSDSSIYSQALPDLLPRVSGPALRFGEEMI